MNIRKSYWIMSLSVLLSLSLVFPYCCHADISEVFSHQTEMSAHVGHSSHSDSGGESCDCGHEFVKDYQKTKKTTDGHSLSLSLAIVLSNRVPFAVSTDFHTFFAIRPGILIYSGPPIHLRNSVFLN